MKLPFQKSIRQWLERVKLWAKPQLEKRLAWCEPRLAQLQQWWQPHQEQLKTWAAPRLAQLQARWSSLAPREKSTVLAGAAITALLVFYALIWSPLNAKLDDLRVQIQGEKKTAAWMQAADKQIRALETKQSKSSVKTLSLRLNVVQEAIRQAPVNQNLTQLTQSATDEIRCVFDHVDFDTLIAWVLGFAQEQQLTVKQASVRRLNSVGQVQAEFVFSVAA